MSRTFGNFYFNSENFTLCCIFLLFFVYFNQQSPRRITPGFQRDNVPLAESRGSASGRVWDGVPSRRKPTKPGFKRGNAPFAESRGSASGRVWDGVPCRPQVDVYFRHPARGESKNSPVDCFWRGDALQERASPKTPHLFLSRRFENFGSQKDTLQKIYEKR